MFLWLRRWPEATLLLLNAIPLVFANMWLSAPRYLLILFPAYVLLARWSRTRTWLWVALIAVMAPLMLLNAYIWGAQWWTA